MVFLFMLLMISFFFFILMSIRLVALITGIVPMDTTLFLVLISSLGHLQSRRLCLAPMLNLNIGDLLMPLQRSLGLNLFYMSCVFVFLIHYFCFVTKISATYLALNMCYTLGANHVLHTRTKHVEIDYHFIFKKIMHCILII